MLLRQFRLIGDSPAHARKPLRASVANVLRQLRLLAEPIDSSVTMHEGLTRTGQLFELAALTPKESQVNVRKLTNFLELNGQFMLLL